MKNKILINKANQRVLVIDLATFSKMTLDFSYREIDAIWVSVTFENVLFEVVRKVRSSQHEKLYLMPIFGHSDLFVSDQSVDFDLIDGFVDSIDHDLLIQRSREINAVTADYANIVSSKFLRTISVISIQVGRFYFSRGRDIIAVPSANSAVGYTIPLLEVLLKEDFSDFLPVCEDLLNEAKRGNLALKFIDKIHMCPECSHSHMNFREICPKCSSSNLVSGQMIHHFVCANVAPAEDYVEHNALVCPKCRRMLRHIGVDYDRPSNMYTCLDCGISFMQPKMVAFCFNCRAVNVVDKLTGLDVYEFRYTSKTYDYLANPDLDLMDAGKKIFNGYIPYEFFVEQIVSEANFIAERTSSESSLFLCAIKINVLEFSDKLDLSEIMKHISVDLRLYLPENYPASFRNNAFYVMISNKERSFIDSTISGTCEHLQAKLQKRYGDLLSCSMDKHLLEFNKYKDIWNFMQEIENF